MTESNDDKMPLSYRGARRLVGLIVLLIIGWYILQSLQSVLLLFVIVFLIAIVLHPVVAWWETHRIPRVVVWDKSHSKQTTSERSLSQPNRARI